MTLPIKPKYPIRDAFQEYYFEFVNHASYISPEQHSAANCIMNCKTGGMGYNVADCPDCGHREIHACSCNNRSCPSCQHMNQEKWKLARQSELIDGIAYYHIIFTVPDVLNVFFLANQKTMYDLLFKSASQTLLTLSADKQHLGARPGIISVLHTWGQQLNFHPHLHLAVSGGGLRKDGTFVETTHKGFFLPLPMVKKMFRGKFLAGFKLLYDTGQLTFPKSTVKLKNPNEWKAFINRLYEKDWCPFIKETFNGHGNALQYLARYSYRTAISNSRIISTDEGYVTLSYKDYRDGEKKQLSLPGEEFIRRFLIHILPKGFTRIRFSGYLANCVRKQNLKKIHKARNTLYRGNPVAKVSASELLMLIYDCDISQCPCCGLTMNFGRSKSREVLME